MKVAETTSRELADRLEIFLSEKCRKKSSRSILALVTSTFRSAFFTLEKRVKVNHVYI
jgi:hypothetical protein